MSSGLKPIQKILEETDSENWVSVERFWIAKAKDENWPLCNVMDGGEGVSAGFVMPEATRLKIGLAVKGRVVSEETKKRMSIAFTGRKMSDENRAKVSEVHKGKKIAPWHLARIIDANRARRKTLIKIKEPRDQMDRLVSEETRQKIRLSKLGKPRSEETKEKLRAANLGKKASLEVRQKMSEAHKGRPDVVERLRQANIGNKHALGLKHTKETKAKVSAASKEMWAERRASNAN